jgi:hypothetical protein
MSTGVAFCPHFAGPCTKIGGAIDGIPGGCEDAGIYQSPETGVFRIVLHCGCDYLTVWSLDGIHDWTVSNAGSVPWCNVSWSDGSVGRLTTRQRPKWLRAKNGTVLALFTGSASKAMHQGDTFTMVRASYHRTDSIDRQCPLLCSLLCPLRLAVLHVAVLHLGSLLRVRPLQVQEVLP